MLNRRRFHMLSFQDDQGAQRLVDLPRPQYEIGNAKHWPGGLTTEWQLRPAEQTDAPNGVEMAPGLWVLAKSIPGIGGLYEFVSLPYHLRRNSPKNVKEALRRQARVNPKTQLIVKELETLSRQMLSHAATSREGATLH